MKKLSIVSLVVFAIVFALAPPSLVLAATAVNLGAADDFAVLAGTAITNTGTSVISGNVGLSPAAGSNYSGLTAVEVTGTIYAVDATGPAGSVNNSGLLTTAKNDLTAAYTAAGQTAVTAASELGGTTKTAGAYSTADGELHVTGTLTLDAEGDPNAVFIFRAASTLTTAGSSNVVLINGAQACNVFWQIGSSATLGTNSFLKGNILALTSATLTTGANVEGRVLARNGAVTLDTNVITKSTCAVPPTPPPTPPPSPASAPINPPLISVTKIPTPLALPAGPGSVTYNYAVSNIGIVPMTSVVVTDNKCANVNFISSDTDTDSVLDLDETWNYSCATTLSQTTTNTVTATGHGNGFITVDTANATVVVALPVLPPLIHLVKKPSVFSLPASGGAVTYMYTVTNPGTEPLANVSVIDDKCTGLPGRVVGHPGDLNQNNLLESNESWSFVCQTHLTQTTTNIGTAEGHANGLTAIDFSPATVVVAPIAVAGITIPPANSPTAPTAGMALPRTGMSFNKNLVLIGLLTLVLASVIADMKKKRTI